LAGHVFIVKSVFIILVFANCPCRARAKEAGARAREAGARAREAGARARKAGARAGTNNC